MVAKAAAEVAGRHQSQATPSLSPWSECWVGGDVMNVQGKEKEARSLIVLSPNEAHLGHLKLLCSRISYLHVFCLFEGKVVIRSGTQKGLNLIENKNNTARYKLGSLFLFWPWQS